jgi:hypothetical protein
MTISRHSYLRVLVASIIVMFLAVNATSQIQQTGEPRSGTPMRNMLEAFRKAAPPAVGQLFGRWVATRTVSTEYFLTGRDGPDHESFDQNGLRRSRESGGPFEWTIVIRETDQVLKVKSNPVWSSETERALDLRVGADLLIDAQFDGDTDETYRCRASGPANLVCLLRGHEYGNGVEFRRVRK